MTPVSTAIGSSAAGSLFTVTTDAAPGNGAFAGVLALLSPAGPMPVRLALPDGEAVGARQAAAGNGKDLPSIERTEDREVPVDEDGDDDSRTAALPFAPITALIVDPAVARPTSSRAVARSVASSADNKVGGPIKLVSATAESTDFGMEHDGLRVVDDRRSRGGSAETMRYARLEPETAKSGGRGAIGDTPDERGGAAADRAQRRAMAAAGTIDPAQPEANAASKTADDNAVIGTTRRAAPSDRIEAERPTRTVGAGALEPVRDTAQRHRADASTPAGMNLAEDAKQPDSTRAGSVMRGRRPADQHADDTAPVAALRDRKGAATPPPADAGARVDRSEAARSVAGLAPRHPASADVAAIASAVVPRALVEKGDGRVGRASSTAPASVAATLRVDTILTQATATAASHNPERVFRIAAPAKTPDADRAAIARIDDDGLSPGAMGVASGPAISHGVSGPPVDLRQESGVQRMLDRIDSLQASDDGRQAKMRLAPEALGTVDIAVRRDGDRLHVHFTAPEAAARAALADAAPRLAELADARGVRLGQTTVDAGTSGSGQQQGREPQPQPRHLHNRLARDDAPHSDIRDHRIA